MDPRERNLIDRRWLRGARRSVVALAGAAVLVTVALIASPGVGVVGVIALPLAVATAAWRWLAAGARRRRGRARRRPAGPLGIAMVEIAAVLATAVAGLSWAQAMGRPSNSSLSIRTVEWLRDQGGAGLVSWIEGVYYASTAPATGGARLRSLPAVGAATTLASAPSPSGLRPALAHLAQTVGPPRLRPLLHPALPREGVWTVTQRRFARARRPPVLVTAYRPAPDYPRLVAGLAWFDHRRTKVSLYAGQQEPPGGATPGGAEVPLNARARLLATFNSGFKHGDSGGGFFANGRLIEPMVDGQGTIVGTQDGRVDVRAWQGGTRPGAGVTFARQNLPLIVDDGRVNPNLSDGTRWGATLGNEILVWRSGVGVDRHGNLIYAAGPYLGVAGLAGILVHAGAVRAIELDINTYWVTLNTYGAPGARAAHALLPTMQRSAQRYLTPDDRDFFAVYER